MEEPRQLGRPKRPLDERIREALKLGELNFDDDHCWPGPRKMAVNGKNTSLLRHVFAVRYGLDELHPTWRVIRPDPAPCQDDTCRNPRHWTLALMNWRGRGPKPVPLPFLPDVKQDDVEDAEWEILSIDDRMKTATEFATLFGTYDPATYAAAMQNLERQGYVFNGS